MDDFKKKLKAEIHKQFGSVNEWSKQNNISSERFYNFLKGSYNPTVKTLKNWLDTVGLELSLKKK